MKGEKIKAERRIGKKEKLQWKYRCLQKGCFKHEKGRHRNK